METFEVIFLIGWAVTLAIRIRPARRSRKQSVALDRRAGIEKVLLGAAGVGFTIIPFVYIFSPWLDFADYALGDGWGWFGAVLLLGAMVILRRAHADLGRQFMIEPVIVEEHRLVAEGIYGYIRHPMYASFGLVVVSQGLLLQNWFAGLSGFVAFIPFILERIPREERMMQEQFGEAYREYMGRTGRLLPRI